MSTLYEMEVQTCSVRGVLLYEMRHVVDPVRGNLAVAEFGESLPFLPRRFFITSGIPSGQVRGEHAHRLCAQFFVCTHGECHVLVDDGDGGSEL